MVNQQLKDGRCLSSQAALPPSGLSRQEASQAKPAAANAVNGPDLWRSILAQMPSGAIVAGGAVRDYLLGFEPKDIDVFIGAQSAPAPADTSFDAARPYDPRHGLMRIEAEHLRFEEYAAVSNILCVSSGTLFGHKVDAVELERFDSPAQLMAEFDFGITRCWFDGREIHDTPEAKSDRESRCITLLLDARVERSIARFERLRARWGDGWRLVRLASCDTRPQGGDANAAPFTSGAVPEGQTPKVQP